MHASPDTHVSCRSSVAHMSIELLFHACAYGHDTYVYRNSLTCMCVVSDGCIVTRLGLAPFLRLSHVDDSLDSLRSSICRATAR